MPGPPGDTPTAPGSSRLTVGLQVEGFGSRPGYLVVVSASCATQFWKASLDNRIISFNVHVDTIYHRRLNSKVPQVILS